MSRTAPNLINDKMASEVANRITKSQSFTDTNMMVDRFANEDKLVVSDERINYGEYEDDHADDHLDDDVDRYRHQSSPPHSKHIFREKENVRSEKHSDTNNHNKSNSHDDSYADSSSQKKPHDPEDQSMWTEEELYLRKLDMLRKLGELAQAGQTLSQNYSINHDYKMMKFEYDLHTGIRSKQNAIQWMGGMMIGIVKGMEMLNDNVNPFDIKFENTWSSKVTNDITDYYDVLGEIYEKYTTPGKKMAPELKLFLMLTGSAVTIQMFRGISSMAPKSAKELDEDPDLIRQLREKANQDNAENEKKQKNFLQEKMEKEHKAAIDKANDLNLLHTSHNEYSKMRQNAIGGTMDKFNNALILSESCRSAHKSHRTDTEQSSNSKHKSARHNSEAENMMTKQMNTKKEMELIAQNKKLLDIQHELQKMNDENNKIEEFKKDNKKKDTKKTKTDSERDNQKSKKQADDLEYSRLIHQDKHNESSSDDMSSVSSKSSIHVNPNLKSILGKALGKPISKDDISISSSSSSSKSRGKKRGLVLSIDENMFSESSTKKKSDKAKKDFRKTDTETSVRPELISFGKRSNDSGSTGISKKRGRPRKSMDIKIGN